MVIRTGAINSAVPAHKVPLTDNALLSFAIPKSVTFTTECPDI